MKDFDTGVLADTETFSPDQPCRRPEDVRGGTGCAGQGDSPQFVGCRIAEFPLMLSLLPQLFVSGISTGMLYALIALSMTVVYRATTVVNFGQGDIVVGADMVVGEGFGIGQHPGIEILQ